MSHRPLLLLLLLLQLLLLAPAVSCEENSGSYSWLMSSMQSRLRAASELATNESVVRHQQLQAARLLQPQTLRAAAQLLLNSSELQLLQLDSSQCANDSAALLQALLMGESWAMAYVDSDAKPPAGLAQGPLLWLGSYSQCVGTRGPQFASTYCLLNVATPIPSPLTQQLMLSVGLCFPATCSSQEAGNITQALLSAAASLLPLNASVTVLTDRVSCKVPRSQLPWTTEAIVTLSLLTVLLLIIIAASCFDVLSERLAAEAEADTQRQILVNHDDACADEEAPADAAVAEDSAQKQRETEQPPAARGKLTRLLLCFSVYTNGAKLLNTGSPDGTLDCVHGIRFISMTWVILGHTYSFALGLNSNITGMLDKLQNDWTFQAVVNATVSVDTFFVLSGLLVAYLFFRELDRVGGRLSGINWPMFYIHRYWRLTPPYLLVMATYVTLFRYWYEGPMYAQGAGEVDPKCYRNWWQNALYINNFFKEECMGWAWYLANDMQFYVVSPLLLVPLALRPAAGLACIGAALAASLTATGIYSTSQHLNPGALLTAWDFNGLYVKPWFRIGPYLVGMATGYALHRAAKTGRRLRLHWAASLAAWSVAAATALSILYGLYNAEAGRQQLSQPVASLYNSASRTAWAACVAWVVFACVTGNAGWVNRLLSFKAFVPLSRLTYCAYLVHPIMIVTYLTSRQQPIAYDNLAAMYEFLGHTCLSYALAFVASLAFESPLIGVERVLRGRA